jgi:hypothetical protein
MKELAVLLHDVPCADAAVLIVKDTKVSAKKSWAKSQGLRVNNDFEGGNLTGLVNDNDLCGHWISTIGKFKSGSIIQSTSGKKYRLELHEVDNENT